MVSDRPPGPARGRESTDPDEAISPSPARGWPGRKPHRPRGGIAMDDADLQPAVQEDLQSEPRVDAAPGAPSAGFLHIVTGYDGSAPASRALDAAVTLLHGRPGCIDLVGEA